MNFLGDHHRRATGTLATKLVFIVVIALSSSSVHLESSSDSRDFFFKFAPLADKLRSHRFRHRKTARTRTYLCRDRVGRRVSIKVKA